jgi:hypothetical protein
MAGRPVAGAVVERRRLGGQRGERIQLFRRKLDVGDGAIRAEFVDRFGSDDHGGHGGAGQQPGERDLVGRQTPFVPTIDRGPPWPQVRQRRHHTRPSKTAANPSVASLRSAWV